MVASAIPLGRFGEPDEVANAVVSQIRRTRGWAPMDRSIGVKAAERELAERIRDFFHIHRKATVPAIIGTPGLNELLASR
jgi:hypothetical protein